MAVKDNAAVRYEAPMVSVDVFDNVYVVSTPSSFNRTTKKGDELRMEFDIDRTVIQFETRIVERDGDGLIATINCNDERLGNLKSINFRYDNFNDEEGLRFSLATLTTRTS